MNRELFISYFPIDNSVDDLLGSCVKATKTLCVHRFQFFFMKNDAKGYGIFMQRYALGRRMNYIHSLIHTFIHSFHHSFSGYLLRDYHVPGSVHRAG